MLSYISTAPIFTLIDSVKHGNTDILTLLNLGETDFYHVPFEEILNSSNDVSFGVNQIWERYNKPIAGIFNHFVVKHYDSNDKEYYFIAHTNDLSLISRMFNKLCSEFGGGAYNEYKSVSFYEKDKVLKLTAGIVEDGDLPISHFWFQHDIGITYRMSYLQHPLQQLQFMIRVNQRMPNRAPRTDSILSLLNFNIDSILSEQESYRHIEVKNGAVAFVDYVYSLQEKEFGLFDVLAVRIFGSTKSFDRSVQTHVFLSSSTDELPVRAATDAVTKLIRIYGEDMQGSTDLDVQDITAIEDGEYWLGKTWHLNKAHGLQDFDNSAEQNAYSVTVSMDADEGFNLSIICYNSLLKMFS